MNNKIKDTEKINENEEITAENLKGVAGGKKIIVSSHEPFNEFGRNAKEMYEEMKRREFEQKILNSGYKGLEKIRKKMRDEKINQVSDLGADESSLNQ